MPVVHVSFHYIGKSFLLFHFIVHQEIVRTQHSANNYSPRDIGNNTFYYFYIIIETEIYDDDDAMSYILNNMSLFASEL